MGESQHGHVALFIHGFVCAPASSCASRAALTCVVPRRVTHRLYSARQMELGVVRIHIMPLHPTLPPTLTAERKQNRKKSTPLSLNKFMGMKEEGNSETQAEWEICLDVHSSRPRCVSLRFAVEKTHSLPQLHFRGFHQAPL